MKTLITLLILAGLLSGCSTIKTMPNYPAIIPHSGAIGGQTVDFADLVRSYWKTNFLDFGCVVDYAGLGPFTYVVSCGSTAATVNGNPVVMSPGGNYTIIPLPPETARYQLLPGATPYFNMGGIFVDANNVTHTITVDFYHDIAGGVGAISFEGSLQASMFGSFLFEIEFSSTPGANTVATLNPLPSLDIYIKRDGADGVSDWYLDWQFMP